MKVERRFCILACVIGEDNTYYSSLKSNASFRDHYSFLRSFSRFVKLICVSSRLTQEYNVIKLLVITRPIDTVKL